MGTQQVAPSLPRRGPVCQGLGCGLMRFAVSVRCRKCGTEFFVCRSCWRGQGYCSASCRVSARLDVGRRAQSRYRRSPKGREANRRGACRRRRHDLFPPKTVADPSSSAPPACATVPACVARGLLTGMNRRVLASPVGVQPRCDVCGRPVRVVERFPPRGYTRSLPRCFQERGAGP